MRNLTFDHGLLKQPPPGPLQGHAVVVFRRVGRAGEEFHSIHLPGTPVRKELRLAVRNPAEYFACAVDASPQKDLRFSEWMRLAEFFDFEVIFDLAYAVSDARVLAQLRKTDPLRRVRDQVRGVIRREVERLGARQAWEAMQGHAQGVVDDCIGELREFAGACGIAIRSLRLTVRLPEMSADMGMTRSGRVRPPEWLGRRMEAEVRGNGRRDGYPLAAAAESDGRVAADEPVADFGAMGDGDRTPRPVLLGGSAPRQARPGDVILAQLAAYVAEFEARARQHLEREALPTEVRLGEETDCQWAFGARVSVRCRAQGLVVPTPVQSFDWNGECRGVSFDLEVPADAQPRSTVIVMEAFVHDGANGAAVQVARLAMALQIVAEVPAPAPPQTVRAAAARTAFASYAAQDRAEVLARISSIRRSAGLEVFVDVVSLRTGEQWEPALREHILASDRFLLFWSEHARDSQWVTWEWQQALDAKGDEALELHLLRHVPADEVPERLRKFHFDDVYLRARDAELYRRGPAALPAVA